jgi:hypothetical protein
MKIDGIIILQENKMPLCVSSKDIRKQMTVVDRGLKFHWRYFVVIKEANRAEGILKVKVKVKLFLCLPKHLTMKTYWVSGGIAPLILDLGPRWR